MERMQNNEGRTPFEDLTTPPIEVTRQHQIHKRKLMNVCNVKGKEKKHGMHQ